MAVIRKVRGYATTRLCSLCHRVTWQPLQSTGAVLCTRCARTNQES